MEPRPWYTLIEFDYGGYRQSLALVQIAESARQAAEHSAGFQLGREAKPHRILVFEGEPVRFAWHRTQDYVMQLGEAT